MLQEAGDFVLSALLGVLEGRDSVVVGDVWVRTGVEEDLDDFLVGFAAVAEDDCLEQRCPSEVVDVVEVDVGLHDAS